MPIAGGWSQRGGFLASAFDPHPESCPVNILLVTSEAVPFAKTGGLADVCGSLPVELARLGHQVTLMLPAYRQAKQSGVPIEPTGVSLAVSIGRKLVKGQLLRSRLPDSEVTVYLVEQDDYYDREELYRLNGRDYVDNCERFVFFCRSVLQTIGLRDLRPDIVHANDWQTGLVPAYLKIEHAGVPGYDQARSLFTVHNLAYQGQFWHWDMVLTGLDWKYFNWQQMEFYGQLNLLKTGLVFADHISTVSPRYAQEIQTEEQGCGLHGVLRQRSAVLTGILNGIDYRRWNPKTDPHLTANYDADTFAVGKPLCKRALQAELGLSLEPGRPLLGFIGRLVEQKGIDLVAQVMKEWLETADVQWVILGTGEPKYHELFERLASRYPHKVAARLAFSDSLAHRIEAGADIFLMPSRYEPCGLNQMYSMRYGTVPVVRATGGLADTITNLTDETLAAGTANGFSFSDYSALALRETLSRACAAFTQPDVWSALIRTGMAQDWSWAHSARQYVELYEQMTACRMATAH
jgi:starch synthase